MRAVNCALIHSAVDNGWLERTYFGETEKAQGGA
jgi:hypothetical protein